MDTKTLYSVYTGARTLQGLPASLQQPLWATVFLVRTCIRNMYTLDYQSYQSAKSGGRTCKITRGSFFFFVPPEGTSSRGSIFPRPANDSDFDTPAEGARDGLVVPVRSAGCFPEEDTLRPPFLPVRAESGCTPPARAPSKTGFFRSRSAMDVGGAHVLVAAPAPAPRADDAFTLVSAPPPLSTERRPTVRASHSSMLARADADLRGLTAFSSCKENVR